MIDHSRTTTEPVGVSGQPSELPQHSKRRALEVEREAAHTMDAPAPVIPSTNTNKPPAANPPHLRKGSSVKASTSSKSTKKKGVAKKAKKAAPKALTTKKRAKATTAKKTTKRAAPHKKS